MSIQQYLKRKLLLVSILFIFISNLYSTPNNKIIDFKKSYFLQNEKENKFSGVHNTSKQFIWMKDKSTNTTYKFNSKISGDTPNKTRRKAWIEQNILFIDTDINCNNSNCNNSKYKTIRDRMELKLSSHQDEDHLKMNETEFYTFDILLDSNSKHGIDMLRKEHKTRFALITQVWQAPDPKQKKYKRPIFAIEFDYNQNNFNVMHMKVIANTDDTPIGYIYSDTVHNRDFIIGNFTLPYDKWNKIIIRIHPDFNKYGNGSITIWLNKVQKKSLLVKYQGPIGYKKLAPRFSTRIGIYRSGLTPRQKILFKNVSIGSNINVVD